VEQAVDAAEVDERAEVGHVRDHAAHEVALAHVLEQALLGGVALILDELAARDDDVAALFVDLEDHRAHGLAHELADVAGAADVDLRRGEEDRHADVDEQAALDLAHALALDDVAFLAGLEDGLPAADAVGLALREAHAARLVLEALEEDLDLVAHGDVGVLELGLIDEAFALQADLDDHMVAREAHDAALEDAARCVRAHFLGNDAVHVAGRDGAEARLAEHALHFAVAKLEILDQVVVDHWCVVFLRVGNEPACAAVRDPGRTTVRA